MRGLFVNQVKNQCSIYESGLMIYNALKQGKEYDLDYLETTVEQDRYEGYDFYVFNWHHNTLPIPASVIKAIKGLTIGILLEVGPSDLRPFMHDEMFNAYMVLDPTKEDTGKYYSFPRPLEKVDSLLPLLSEDIPVIGTFGFLVPGKNFEEVLKQANNLETDCILRMNFPDAKFTGVPFQVVKDFGRRLQIYTNKNVDLRITHDYMSKSDLIKWCSQNSLNVFPYYRNLPGLSAVTDQAIVANRGIAITNCDTFRHMHKYISYYPAHSYMELTTSTLPGIKKMQEDWSNERFVNKFNRMLAEQFE